MHGPLGRVLARPCGDELIGIAFLSQKTEHRVERRQADRPFAQALCVQPVLVETETRRQNVRDGLMQTGDEHATDAGFSHSG